MKNFEYVMPKSVAEASEAGAQKGARLKAAGMDLLDEMKAYVATPDKLVNLLTVPGMRDIADQKDGTHVGALVTLAQIAAADGLPAVLRQAADEAATPQVRNVATVGGNLAQRPRCWYYRSDAFTCSKKGGDTCHAIDGENQYHAIFHTKPCPIVHPSNLAPALVALDAQVITNKRSIDIEKFFVLPKDAIDRENVLEPGEVITSIVFPARARWATAFREGRDKESFSWALVAAAVALRMDGDAVGEARVVLGAVAPVPLRSKEAEAALAGQKPTAEVAAKAAEAAFKGATPLSENGYKVAMGKAILKRTILAAAEGK
jgi:xanthine dehydrogenase YagS FAD-binding subunit